MFRKITLTAVPAVALALMFCAADNSASQAFAKAGNGGHGVHKMENHRNFHNRFYGRYYGYGYGYEYPTVECTAVCQPKLPVVAEPVVPVCTTCEPVCTELGVGFWGHRYHRDHRGNGFHPRPLAERGHGPVRR